MDRRLQNKLFNYSGNGELEYRMACAYFYGQGADKNEKEALYWFRKSALKGHTDSLLMLGNIYRDGKIVKRHIKRAFYYYRKAARLGQPLGLHTIGMTFQEGEFVTKDMDLAIENYEEAALAGVYMAYYQLGIIYYKGLHKIQSYRLAFKWFLAAAEDERAVRPSMSDYTDFSKLDYYLGKMYLEGLGTDKDFEKASHYLKTAAELENQEAINILKEWGWYN